jgi:hypothetical protein
MEYIMTLFFSKSKQKSLQKVNKHYAFQERYLSIVTSFTGTKGEALRVTMIFEPDEFERFSFDLVEVDRVKSYRQLYFSPIGEHSNTKIFHIIIIFS